MGLMGSTSFTRLFHAPQRFAHRALVQRHVVASQDRRAQIGATPLHHPIGPAETLLVSKPVRDGREIDPDHLVHSVDMGLER